MTEHIAKGPGQLSSPGPEEDGGLLSHQQAYDLIEKEITAIHCSGHGGVCGPMTAQIAGKVAGLWLQVLASHDQARLDAVLKAIGGLETRDDSSNYPSEDYVIARNALRVELCTKIKAIWGIK